MPGADMQRAALATALGLLMAGTARGESDFAVGNYRYFPGRDRTAFVEIGYALD